MISRFLWVLCAVVLAGSLAAAPTEKQDAPTARTTGKRAKEKAIAKGMTAEAVLQALGQPEEIRPMKSNGPKAEVWVYKRVLQQRTEQTATGVDVHPAFTGDMQETGTVTVPSTRLERITTYQMTYLLMIDGVLEHAKQGREVERHFD